MKNYSGMQATNRDLLRKTGTMMMHTKIRPHKGSGMIIGLFTISIVFALAVSFMSITSSSLLSAKRDVIRTRALSCAEAGIDRAIDFLMEGGPNGEERGEWRDQHTETLEDGGSYKVYAYDGSGITEGKIVIISQGTATQAGASVTKKIKVVVSFNRENVNVWNNAIFGGVGQSGKSINGNVAIHGSVHLLGDGEDFTDVDGDGHWDSGETYTDSNHNGQYDLGEPYTDTDGDGHRDGLEPFYDDNGNGIRDPALTVTDMASEISGNANIGNNYSSMPTTLKSLVPTLEQEAYGGEMVDTLEAKLRVKHGTVNISGSATVGEPNATGDTNKETVDGVYVSDGFGGNAGSANVYSDNGYAHGYDLGDGVVSLPIIDRGSYTSDSTTYSTYLAYLYANATVYSGDLNITKGTVKSITGTNGSLSIDSAGNMTISGIVYVTGDITFGPSKSTIVYSGSGLLVSPGSSYIHCNLLPKTNFPKSDVLGLCCGDKVELATGSGDAQLTMAIAMYAQHQIISSKQNEIAGTMVTSFFSMSNVPRLYQVPELANYLPAGVPGKDPIWIASISIESWQEIK
ncbi:hypothetical protein LLG46_09885 [bacterium]|nr:hypothetical protein [bacterium]